MANSLYPKWKEASLSGAPNSTLNGTVKAALVDTGTYAYSAAHEFLPSLTGIVGTPQTLMSKTYANGILDAADVTFPLVTGPTAEAIVIYIDTGVAATSRLVAFLDTGFTNLPITPNGSDILVTWNALGIFGL